MRNPDADITVLTTTNFAKYCPSTRLIEQTIDSFNSHFGMSAYRHIIFCDLSKSPGPDHYRYLDNLHAMRDKYPSRIEILSGAEGSMKPGWLTMVQMVQTPFLFFLEHDWEFLRRVNLRLVLDVMDRYDFVNLMRFNRRRNILARWDYHLAPEPRITELHCLRSWCFSNCPYVAKTKAVREWLPIVRDDRVFTDKHWVEGPLQTALFIDAMKNTYAEAQARWGIFLYGAFNFSQVSRHLDGREGEKPMETKLMQAARAIYRHSGFRWLKNAATVKPGRWR